MAKKNDTNVPKIDDVKKAFIKPFLNQYIAAQTFKQVVSYVREILTDKFELYTIEVNEEGKEYNQHLTLSDLAQIIFEAISTKDFTVFDRYVIDVKSDQQWDLKQFRDLFNGIKKAFNLLQKLLKSSSTLPENLRPYAGTWVLFGPEATGKSFHLRNIARIFKVPDANYVRIGEIAIDDIYRCEHDSLFVESALALDSDCGIIIIDSMSDLVRRQIGQGGFFALVVTISMNDPDLLYNTRSSTAAQTSGISTNFANFFGALSRALQMLGKILIVSVNPLSANENARAEMRSLIISKAVAYANLSAGAYIQTSAIIWTARVLAETNFVIQESGFALTEATSITINEDAGSKTGSIADMFSAYTEDK